MIRQTIDLPVKKCSKVLLKFNLTCLITRYLSFHDNAGIGGNASQTHRVGSSPNDVSKLEIQFIVWLILEQEFSKTNQTEEITQNRTQHDGISAPQEVIRDDDDDEDEENLTLDHTNRNKLDIARECT